LNKKEIVGAVILSTCKELKLGYGVMIK